MTPNNTLLTDVSSSIFISDGGLETTLVFQDGIDLPCFAAFDLLKDEQGKKILKAYYKRYLNLAKDFKTGFILETPTWRANPDWIHRVGLSKDAIKEVNISAVQLLLDLKMEFYDEINEILISGQIGPRGDGYKPEFMMDIETAHKYHSAQIDTFKDTSIDLVTAFTINYVQEAIGITRAANQAKIPAVISFTVETNGLLPTGMSLKDAIELVDSCTETPPAYYMINCAHPSHFMNQLLNQKNQYWVSRIKGIRANASCKSHDELDESTELDRGNPMDLGNTYRVLKNELKHLNIFGGCCGTDTEHIHEIIRQITQID